ncbi:hypothetical protein [Paenibacillus hexagrammi]|uniref:Uncharacterized protein n=1 Tax=Paenibacillus hexagrammi TaxID=2908839 RepID=A0ABY3SE85_9BACL|nr:hypothetical protein [Paenibacillus sp. YPD9-1]UJF31227.1 hypothetical protein L0M14_15220 [Paenibacillus sp. YPD9-1]
MPSYANHSLEATQFLQQKTGSTQLDCYTYIDPENTEKSFFVVKTSNKVIHVSFSEIEYNPLDYRSLLEGLYQVIYE